MGNKVYYLFSEWRQLWRIFLILDTDQHIIKCIPIIIIIIHLQTSPSLLGVLLILPVQLIPTELITIITIIIIITVKPDSVPRL